MNTIINKIKNVIKGSKFENRAYVVGGFVRDHFMGLGSNDIDIVVTDLDINGGIELALFLYNVLNLDHFPVIYPRFGTAQILIDGTEVEIVGSRKEIYNFKNRKPVVIAGTLEDDANRRDFTINSIFYNISQDLFVDPKNGIEDIRKKLIRTTSDSKTIFAEDPLRILRAIRFSSQLNFEIEDDTFNAIVEFVPWLKNISRERIRDEFNKILVTNNFSKGINYLKVSGILSYLIPEISKFDSVQNETSQYHTKNLFNHTLEVMSEVPPTVEHRLAALFHDVGKVNTMTVDEKGVHFYNHQFYSMEIVKRFMTEYKYTNDQIEMVKNSVMMHMNFLDNTVTEKTIRKMVDKYGKEQVLFFIDLAFADSKNIEHKKVLQSIVDFINTNQNTVEFLKRLPVNGDMIMKRYNLKPSKKVGELLNIEKEYLFEFPEANEMEIYQILDKNV